MYQTFSYLPEDIAYHCRLCYPMRPAPWETIIKEEMQAGFTTVIGNMLATKLAANLTRIEDEVKVRLHVTLFSPCPLWLISIARLGVRFGLGIGHGFLYYADAMEKGSESESQSVETCSVPSLSSNANPSPAVEISHYYHRQSLT